MHRTPVTLNQTYDCILFIENRSTLTTLYFFPVRFHSISDCEEICMGISDETTDEQAVEVTTWELKVRDVPNRRKIIREKAAETARKLCHLGRSLSLGTVPIKHEYVGLLTSPDEVQSCLRHFRTSQENRALHPLTRQIAVEEKHCDSNTSLKIFTENNRSGALTYPTGAFDINGHSPDKSNLSTPTISISPLSSHNTFEEHRGLRHCPATGSRHFSDSDFSKYSSMESALMPSQQLESTSKEALPTDACVISSIDPPERDKTMSRIRSARSIIEHERRVRIRKLQSDLLRIQKELQDLHELEYEVSCV